METDPKRSAGGVKAAETRRRQAHMDHERQLAVTNLVRAASWASEGGPRALAMALVHTGLAMLHLAKADPEERALGIAQLLVAEMRGPE